MNKTNGIKSTMRKIWRTVFQTIIYTKQFILISGLLVIFMTGGVALRQPGSSIKPLLSYGPAMEEGVVQPASIIDDTPDFTYNHGVSMRNYVNRYYGLVTVRDALVRSHNATAYKVFAENRDHIGVASLYAYMQKLGLKHIGEEEMSHNSATLGGLSRGITVLENTAAYSTFANKGEYKKPYMIQRIETMDGTIIYEHNTPLDIRLEIKMYG